MTSLEDMFWLQEFKEKTEDRNELAEDVDNIVCIKEDDNIHWRCKGKLFDSGKGRNVVIREWRNIDVLFPACTGTSSTGFHMTPEGVELEISKDSIWKDDGDHYCGITDGGFININEVYHKGKGDLTIYDRVLECKIGRYWERDWKERND